MVAETKKGIWKALLIWMLVALGLLMAPYPREWGLFGGRFSATLDHVLPVLQPLVHVLLMASGSILLMRIFSKQTPATALLCSLGIALILAFALEILQSFLPHRFSRQCDMADLVPSFAGALAGCLVGLVPCGEWRIKQSKGG